jgi:hypothetical protein
MPFALAGSDDLPTRALRARTGRRPWSRSFNAARRGSVARWPLDANPHAPLRGRFETDDRKKSDEESSGWKAQRRPRGGGGRVCGYRPDAAMRAAQGETEDRRVGVARRSRGSPDGFVGGLERGRLREGGGAAIVAERRQHSGLGGAAQRPASEHDTRKDRCAKRSGHHRARYFGSGGGPWASHAHDKHDKNA